MSEPSNEDRAEWARTALEAFATASRCEDEPMADQINDLILDLMHLLRFECGIEDFDAGRHLAGLALMHDMEIDEDEEEGA